MTKPHMPKNYNDRLNCWETFSSKLSIVPETVASMWLVAPGSSPSRSCDACTSSFSIHRKARSSWQVDPRMLHQCLAGSAKPPWWCFPQHGPEAWRNDSVTLAAAVSLALSITVLLFTLILLATFSKPVSDPMGVSPR